MDIRKILVVDDEESMCNMLTSFLAMSGYECQSTTGPAQALAFLLQSFAKKGLLWPVNPHGIWSRFFERQKCSAKNTLLSS
jgi:DNA-binding NtrC family response regulator